MVEDSDDLVPIFDKQSEILSRRHGEFLLASIIENQDEHNRTLAGEAHGTAVGLIALTDVVELDVLRYCFDLEPYDFLLRPAPEARHDDEHSEHDRAVSRGEMRDEVGAAAEDSPANGGGPASAAVASPEKKKVNADDIFGDDDEYADLEAARRAAEAKAAAERAAEEARQARIAQGLPPESEDEESQVEEEEESLSDPDEVSTDEDE